MNQLVKASLVMASLIGLSACVQVTEEVETKSSQVAVSSVRDLPLSYPVGSTFALSPKYLEHVSMKQQQIKDVYNIYTQAIVENLQSNGYQQAVDSKQADFLVGFGAALQADLEAENVNEKFGISPGLPSVENMRRGSFLIFVDDALSDQRVWRGAVQGFVVEGLDNEERKGRAQGIVNLVLTQFYATK